MVECGKILSVEGDYAKVRFKRHTECEKCRNCSFPKDGIHSEITVPNTLNLCSGDFVKVEVYKRKIRIISVCLYMIALALTALGAGIGTLMSVGASVILAVAGFIVGMAFAVPIDVCVLRKKDKPKMICACTEEEYDANTK